MTMPPYEDPGRSRPRPTLDAGRLWTGGVATAAVAALVAVVGVLIARGLFEVPLLAPTREGAWGDASTARLAGLAAMAALLSANLDGPALRTWGWRLAFLLALPLGLVGLYIRRRIEETPGFRAVQRLEATARAPLADTLRTARREVVAGFGIVVAVTATFNIVFVFLPSHLATTGRAPWPGRWPRPWWVCWSPPRPRPSPGGSPTGWVAGRSWSLVSSLSWS